MKGATHQYMQKYSNKRVEYKHAPGLFLVDGYVLPRSVLLSADESERFSDSKSTNKAEFSKSSSTRHESSANPHWGLDMLVHADASDLSQSLSPAANPFGAKPLPSAKTVRKSLVPFQPATTSISDVSLVTTASNNNVCVLNRQQSMHLHSTGNSTTGRPVVLSKTKSATSLTLPRSTDRPTSNRKAAAGSGYPVGLMGIDDILRPNTSSSGFQLAQRLSLHHRRRRGDDKDSGDLTKRHASPKYVREDKNIHHYLKQQQQQQQQQWQREQLTSSAKPPPLAESRIVRARTPHSTAQRRELHQTADGSLFPPRFPKLLVETENLVIRAENEWSMNHHKHIYHDDNHALQFNTHKYRLANMSERLVLPSQMQHKSFYKTVNNVVVVTPRRRKRDSS